MSWRGAPVRRRQGCLVDRLKVHRSIKFDACYQALEAPAITHTGEPCYDSSRTGSS